MSRRSLCSSTESGHVATIRPDSTPSFLNTRAARVRSSEHHRVLVNQVSNRLRVGVVLVVMGTAKTSTSTSSGERRIGIWRLRLTGGGRDAQILVRYRSMLTNVSSGDLKMKLFWPNYQSPMPPLETTNSLIWRFSASLIKADILLTELTLRRPTGFQANVAGRASLKCARPNTAEMNHSCSRDSLPLGPCGAFPRRSVPTPQSPITVGVTSTDRAFYRIL